MPARACLYLRSVHVCLRVLRGSAQECADAGHMQRCIQTYKHASFVHARMGMLFTCKDETTRHETKVKCGNTGATSLGFRPCIHHTLLLVLARFLFSAAAPLPMENVIV